MSMPENSVNIARTVRLTAQDFVEYGLSPSIIAAALVGDALQQNAILLAGKTSSAHNEPVFDDDAPSAFAATSAQLSGLDSKQRAAVFPTTDAIFKNAAEMVKLSPQTTEDFSAAYQRFDVLDSSAIKLAVANTRGTLYALSTQGAESLPQIASNRIKIVTGGLGLALVQDKTGLPVETLKMVANKTLSTMPVLDRHISAVYAKVLGIQQDTFMVPVRHDLSARAVHIAPKS